MSLENKKCKPCEGGVEPLRHEDIQEYMDKISNQWIVEENKKVRKQFKFQDFKKSISFVNKVANLAEEEQHHPDICINFNTVKIELSTHAIGGLSENDFIMASKIDKL